MTSEQQQLRETYDSLSKLIDVHVLDPVLSPDQVFETCTSAIELGVRAVIVRPCDLELAAPWFRGSGVLLGSVAGYPDGTSTTSAKLYEGRDLLRSGALELEFVLNPAHMISRGFQHVETELLQISRSCQESGARLTVVYNSHRLADDLKIIATKICRRVESKAISIDGSPEELALLRPLLRDDLRLKRNRAANTLEDALAARAQGFTSFAAAAPRAVLDAWRQHLAAQEALAAPVVS